MTDIDKLEAMLVVRECKCSCKTDAKPDKNCKLCRGEGRYAIVSWPLYLPRERSTLWGDVVYVTIEVM